MSSLEVETVQVSTWKYSMFTITAALSSITDEDVDIINILTMLLNINLLRVRGPFTNILIDQCKEHFMDNTVVSQRLMMLICLLNVKLPVFGELFIKRILNHIKFQNDSPANLIIYVKILSECNIHGLVKNTVLYDIVNDVLLENCYEYNVIITEVLSKVSLKDLVKEENDIAKYLQTFTRFGTEMFKLNLSDQFYTLVQIRLQELLINQNSCLVPREQQITHNFVIAEDINTHPDLDKCIEDPNFILKNKTGLLLCKLAIEDLKVTYGTIQRVKEQELMPEILNEIVAVIKTNCKKILEKGLP